MTGSQGQSRMARLLLGRAGARDPWERGTRGDFRVEAALGSTAGGLWVREFRGAALAWGLWFRPYC